MGSTDWGEVFASTVGTTTAMGGTMTLELTLEDACCSEVDLFAEGTGTVAELGGVSSENPVGTAGMGGLITMGLSTSATSSEPDVIFVAFRRDCVPYSRVEKQAVNIFNLLHKNNKITLNKTAIRTKTVGMYEAFKKLFWLPTESVDYERILVIEKILEKIANE